MAKTYKNRDFPILKVEELPPVTATALKNTTADVLDQLATQGAVAITRHDKPKAVLLSIERFEQLTGHGDDWLADLHEEYRGMLEKMQAPEQKEAAIRAFNATPEELGKAAVAAAMRKAREVK
ncbi:MAG: type II toxin-antitoxin system Phd/YefM family antitoxin [Opitutales bacterium]|nr:type II toxin-antitoxin system Phd/YefM family antitoxin [Opitutales bacterium]